MADPALEKLLNRGEANPQAPGDPTPTPTPPTPPRNRPGQPNNPTAILRPQLPNIPTLPIPTPTEGNAVYRIDPAGFVTEVFRENVMILSIIEKEGTLLVGTGSEGLVYQVNPAAEETQVLAKVNPKQVMSMLATKDGRVMLGPRYSVNRELRRFSPRDPGEPLDGIGQYAYPSRPSIRKIPNT